MRKEFLEKFAKKILISTLPSALVAILSIIEETKDEKELANKFAELKKYSDDLLNKIPLQPIAVEKELVSSVVIYFDKYLGDDSISYLEEDLKKEIDDNSIFCYIEDFYITTDNIIINSVEEIEKKYVEEYIVQYVRNVLIDDGIRIQSIIFI